MAQLKHDESGFLTGDKIELDRQNDWLESISADIKAIRALLSKLNFDAATASTLSKQAPARPNRAQSTTNAIAKPAQLPAIEVKAVAHQSTQNHYATTNNNQNEKSVSGVNQNHVYNQTAARHDRAAVSYPIGRVRARDEKGRFVKETPAQPAATVAYKPKRAQETGGQLANEQASPAKQSALITHTAKALPPVVVMRDPAKSNQQVSEKNASVTRRSERKPAEPKPKQRDANGRFMGGGESKGLGAGRGSEDGFISRLADKIGSSVSDGLDLAGEAEQVDPTIAAFNEVAEPVAKAGKMAVSLGSGALGAGKGLAGLLGTAKSKTNSNGDASAIIESKSISSFETGGLLSGQNKVANQGVPAEPVVKQRDETKPIDQQKHQSGAAQRLPGQMRAIGTAVEPAPSRSIVTTQATETKRDRSSLKRLSDNVLGLRKEQTTYNKTEKKLLKELVDKPAAIDGEEGGGFLGGLIGGFLPMILAALSGIGAAVMGFFTGIGSMVMAVLAPIGAALLSVFSGLGSALLTGVTTVLGAVFSPIGLAIAGAAALAWGLFTEEGRKFFSDVGGWIAEKVTLAWDGLVGILNATFPETMAALQESWDAGVALFNTGWDMAVDSASQAFDWLKTQFEPIVKTAKELFDWLQTAWNDITATISGVFEGFSNFLKDKFGVDIPKMVKSATETVSGAYQSAKSAVTTVVDKTKETASKAVEATKEKTGQVVEAAKSTASKVVDTGKTVAKQAVEKVNYGIDVASEKATNIAAKVTGTASDNKNALLVEMANQGITDPKEQAMLMAQVDHESGGFAKTKENTNYRSADRVMQLSKSARNAGKPAVEAAVAQGGDAVAELMYGGRMGNTEKGDGAKYKGRGLIQLTGKDNYAAASKDLGIDLVNHPELAESPEVAAKTAVWFWKKNKLSEKAKQGDVLGVTKRVNGGTNGLEDREKKYTKYLAAAQSGDLTAKAAKVTAATQADKVPQPTVLAQAGANGAASTKPATEASGKPTVAAGQSPQTIAGLGATPAPALLPSPTSPIVVATAAPIKPILPAAPTPADPITIKEPLNTPQRMASTSSTAIQPDVGQDLSDRRIAHIVSGGYSRA